jgi:hypothetical protein
MDLYESNGDPDALTEQIAKEMYAIARSGNPIPSNEEVRTVRRSKGQKSIPAASVRTIISPIILRGMTCKRETLR